MSSRSIVLAALTMAACDSAAPGSYQGEPLFELKGTVDGVDLSTNARAALVWSIAGDDGRTLVIDQASQVKSNDQLFYELQLFNPPPEHVMQKITDSSVWRVATGHTIVFDDLNNNGIWDSDAREPLLGGNDESVILYAEPVEYDGSSRTDAPELGMQAGFRVMDARHAPCNDVYEAMRNLTPRRRDVSNMAINPGIWEFLGDTMCDTPQLRFGKIMVLEEACPPAEDLPYFCSREDEFGGLLADHCWDYCDELVEHQQVAADLGTCPQSIGEAVEVCRGLNDQTSLAPECEDLVCATVNDRVDIDELGACPNAEDMVWACKNASEAMDRGVHRACLLLFCPDGTVKEAEYVPDPGSAEETTTSSTSSGPGSSGRTPATGKDDGEKGQDEK